MRPPNTILQDRYVLIRLIGQGGMGAVYEALDQRLNSRVALKETFVNDDQFREAFEREARLLAYLRHPALPKVTDYFFEGNGQFLVMEYIPGEDLASLLLQRDRPFAVDAVLRWTDRLLDALEYLHSQHPPVIHRDIKPANLKFMSDGEIVLLDFGLAKGQPAYMSHLTATISIMGYTPNYAPLEQIQGSGTDARSDLYALAATMYHLLTGNRPPDALTRVVAVTEDQPDPLRPANELNPLVPTGVTSMLMRALSLSRDKRPNSAIEMRRALGFSVRNVEDSAPSVDIKTTKGTGTREDTTQIVRSENKAASPTLLEEASQPIGFFTAAVDAVGGTRFFAGEDVRYSKIQETLTFYRDHLNKEYQSLSKQANLTYSLWICCVALGFCILIAGIIMMLTGSLTQGVATTACTVIVYFIQRIFQQREDHYRKLASAKNSHLEYGNQWLLVIQSIDAIDEPKEKMKRQARLVAVLTDKLKSPRHTD
jgi:serine/threonine protein kinase